MSTEIIHFLENKKRSLASNSNHQVDATCTNLIATVHVTNLCNCPRNKLYLLL